MKKSKQTKPFTLLVGVDASKGKADSAIVSAPHDPSAPLKWNRKRLPFNYTIPEAERFLSTIRKYKLDGCQEVVIAMEVTGVYHETIYGYLQDHILGDEKVVLLEPRFVNRWCELHDRPKSDPLDAQSIATIIATERNYKTVNPNSGPNEKGYSDLKALTHRHSQLKKLKNQEQNRLLGLLAVYFPEATEVLGKGAAFLAVVSKYPSCHDIISAPKEEVFNVAYEASRHHFKMDKIDTLYNLCAVSLALVPSETDRQIIRNMIETIQLFNSQIKEMNKQIQEQAQKLYGYLLLITLTGCGPITAATVIAEIGDISRFKSADKLVSYAGINPANKKSGASIDVLGHITKKGSKYLRHALFMIGEFARRHNPVLKALFERVKAGNRKRHKAAVVAVANKIVRYVYSILKHGTKFVITYKDLMKLPEETRNTFFQSITTDIPKRTNRAVYYLEKADGTVAPFCYIKKTELDLELVL